MLVPAEFLGVASGLGYAIDGGRDTLEYDPLTAAAVTVDIICFVRDSTCVRAIERAIWILAG